MFDMPDAGEIHSSLSASKRKIEELRSSLDVAGKALRIDEIRAAQAKPGFWDNQTQAQASMEELKGLTAVVEPVAEVGERLQECLDMLELAQEENDLREIEQVGKDAADIPGEIDRLETMALLSGPHDRDPCFFSIHTGAGGSDACEWAEMLLRMYTRFFERKGWKTEELSFVPGEEAGIKGVDLRVIGQFAYGYLRSELGVHRLVRISPFSGRRETSFAAVDVVADIQQEVEIEINEGDLKIDRIHASGKGGQHVNKTASAVRVTHLPTNLVVTVQNERSQHRNKDMAMKILRSRLVQREEAKREAEENQRNAAKMENAWGSQIRNYVLHPYTLVKDARTTYESGDIQKILDGNLDDFIDAYLRWSVGPS